MSILCSSKYRGKRYSQAKFNLEKAVLRVDQEHETVYLTDEMYKNNTYCAVKTDSDGLGWTLELTLAYFAEPRISKLSFSVKLGHLDSNFS